MKSVIYAPIVLRDLGRYGNMSARVRKAIAEYAAETGAHANNVPQMENSTGKRLRVGSYRALFEETDSTITVTRVGPLGGIYE